MEELPQGEWQGRLSWVGGRVFESGCSRRQELLGSWGNGRMRKMLETIKGKKKKKRTGGDFHLLDYMGSNALLLRIMPSFSSVV